MRLIRAGKQYKAAAYTMGITIGTFRTVVERAYRKLDVHSRWELMARRSVR